MEETGGQAASYSKLKKKKKLIFDLKAHASNSDLKSINIVLLINCLNRKIFSF